MKAGAVIAVAGAAAILAWLYVALKPAPGPSSPGERPMAATAPRPGPATFGAPAAAEFSFTIAGGKLGGEPQTMRVTAGASVLIRVASDRADELHLHGYDLELALRPGVPGVLAFTADKAGRFDLELHHAQLTLGALEVQPR